MIFQLRKLRSTARILLALGLARTFGEYVHSGWNGEFDFTRYRWRGKEWIIPTSAVESDQ
jgi:hypothetical protein